MTRLTLLILLLATQAIKAQGFTVSGYVVDSRTGETLPNATVRQRETNNAVLTNRYGFFSIRINPNTTLLFSYVGYEGGQIELRSRQDTTLTIRLFPATTELEQVVVKTRKESVLTQPIGKINIPISQLKSVPALFGEADIIKALALTPGVTVGNEGTTGLLVRGGSSDQNLILLDNATVYNAAHLFGFVSTFNPDAVKNVDLYKASFPARYGGRLSSVVDIIMKEGNIKRRVKEMSVL